MTPLLAAWLILLCGALAALAAGRRTQLAGTLGTLSVALGGLCGLGAALPVLLGAGSQGMSAPWSVPGGGFVLSLDPLAAFFLLPICLLSPLCALYAGPYLRHAAPDRPLGGHWFFFNLLVAALLLVVTAANAVLFLAAWELMTISSFFLVAWDHRLPEVRRAAWLYLVLAHGGLMVLLALFLQAGTWCASLDFGDFGPLAELSAPAAASLFLLALGGFGVKAGLFPLHVWLPDAHPAAPSHVSALLSAVVVKVGLYGLLRVLSWLPPAPAWWGWGLVLLGGLGALYGIALALLQRDIKRCLAYSTVENVGLMVLGLGFSLVASARGEYGAAALALAGALLHLWNHALFKGLLFLGAGSLVHGCGSRDLNGMGGLLRRMPVTAGLCIGGAMAISALPPLNGLAGEWLIYLGLLRSGLVGGSFAALPALLLVGLLGLVGALALAAFARLVGIALLGQPRSPGAAAAQEASRPMLLPMALLLGGCLLLGIYPQVALGLLAAPLAQLNPEAGAVLVPASAPLAALGHWALGLWLALAAVATLLFRLRRRHPLSIGPTWGCGFALPTARMAYTAAGFAELGQRHLLPRWLAAAQPAGGRVAGLLASPARLEQQFLDPCLHRWLLPLAALLGERCLRLRWLQQGRLPIYLLYIFLTCALLLGWSVFVGGG